MVYMLKDISKHHYQEGETFRSVLAAKLLQDRKGNEQEKRRVSSCAVIEKNGKHCRLKLFDTHVADFRQDGGVVLDSGGWRTRYTRNVLDSLLPEGVHLCSEGGLWVLRGPHFEGGFRDGCVVFEDGRVYHAMTPAELADRKALLEKAHRFTNRYCDRLLDGKVPPPGLGDCLYCQVESGASKAQTGVLQEDGTVRPHTFEESSSHIVHHVDEGYFVPSLLHNAINDCGRLSWDAKAVLTFWWHQGGKETEGCLVKEAFYRERSRRGWMELRRTLWRYLKKRLGCEFGGRGWQSG